MSEDLKIVVTADTSQLDAQLNSTSNKLKNFQGASNKAGMALNDLSRIAQDAPYGFIGISNNINPLVESFGRLKAESGSTGGALKALGAGLAGPAGVGLAFGILSAAISFASVGLDRWVKKTGESKDATQNFTYTLETSKKVVDDLKTSFDSFNNSQDKALSIWSNFAKLTIPNKIQADLTVSRMEFIQIGEAIVEQEGNVEKLKNNYYSASKSLRKFTTDQAGAFDDYGVSNFEKKLNELARTFGRLEDVPSSALKGFTDEQQSAIQAVLQSYKGLTDAQGKLSDLQNQRELKAIQNRLLATQSLKKEGESVADILAKFERQLIAINNIGLLPEEVIKKKIDAFQAVISKLIKDKSLSENNKIVVGLQLRLQDIQITQITEEWKKKINDPAYQEKLFKEFNTEPIEIKLPVSLSPELQQAESAYKDFEAKIRYKIPKFYLNETGFFNLTNEGKANIIKPFKEAQKLLQEKTAETLGSIAPDSLIAIGEALGAAIASGTDPILAGFNALFGVMGEAMITLGKYAIMYSSAIVALQETLKKAGGVSGIAIGIGLILLGTLIKTAVSGIGKKAAFATGTLSAPGGMALVGERGPEMVNLPRGARVTPAAQTASMMGGISQGIEVFGMLRGQDIYFSNKKYSKTYNRAT